MSKMTGDIRVAFDVLKNALMSIQNDYCPTIVTEDEEKKGDEAPVALVK